MRVTFEKYVDNITMSSTGRIYDKHERVIYIRFWIGLKLK